MRLVDVLSLRRRLTPGPPALRHCTQDEMHLRRHLPHPLLQLVAIQPRLRLLPNVRGHTIVATAPPPVRPHVWLTTGPLPGVAESSRAATRRQRLPRPHPPPS